MHARIGYSRIEPDAIGRARTFLNDEMLPRVKQMPGVHGGYWLEPVEGEGMAVVIFDSKEAAEKGLPNTAPGDSPMPGVTVERVEIREVLAEL